MFAAALAAAAPGEGPPPRQDDGALRDVRQQLHDKPGAQISIDLESQTVTGPDGVTYRFDLDPNHKERLLKGLDDVAERQRD